MVARIIALEEHFWTPELIALRRTVDQVNPKSVERLGDLGALRLREMDAADIDVQVLSEAEPGVQNLAPDQAVPLARVSNDLLFEAMQRHPDRFAGFATLPTPDPAAAVRELERTVKELRFCGAMVHGSTRGHFLDERQFWPIFEAAAALDVPIYLHPCTPASGRARRLLQGLSAARRAALGFGIEMAVQAARLVMSGALDEFPRLRIILGHLGRRCRSCCGAPTIRWRAAQICVQLPRIFPRSFLHHHLRELLPPACNAPSQSSGWSESCLRSIGRSSRTARRWTSSSAPRSPPTTASKYSAPAPAGCCASEFAGHNAATAKRSRDQEIVKRAGRKSRSKGPKSFGTPTIREDTMSVRLLKFGLIAGMSLQAATAFAADPFAVTSSAFKDGDVWPAKFAGADPSRTNPPCPGQNVSPPLAWSNAPAGTKSFAIVMFDPDGATAPAPTTGWPTAFRRPRPRWRKARPAPARRSGWAARTMWADHYFRTAGRSAIRCIITPLP